LATYHDDLLRRILNVALEFATRSAAGAPPDFVPELDLHGAVGFDEKVSVHREKESGS